MGDVYVMYQLLVCFWVQNLGFSVIQLWFWFDTSVTSRKRNNCKLGDNIHIGSVAVDIVSKTLTVDSAKTDDDEYREYAT